MSWEAVQWANKQRLRLPQEQFVLLLLANCADPEGLAFGWWKSKDHWWTYLAERSRLSRGTVFRHIATIVEHGLARRQKVVMPDGVTRSTLILDLEKMVSVEAEEIGTPRTASDETERVSRARLTESHGRDSPSLTGEIPSVSPARLQEVYNKEDSNKDSEREACARENLEKLKALSVTASVDDPTKVWDAWDLLPEDEQKPAIAGYPLWLEELKSLGRQYPPSLDKYLDRRNWKGLKPPKKTAEGSAAKAAPPKSYPTNSPEFCALTYLAGMARASLFRLDNKVIYVGEVTPRMLALATMPAPARLVEIGSGQFRAWDDFFGQVFGGKRARLTAIRVPYEWPPRKDGSIINAGSDPPGELSDEDASALAGM